MLSPSQSEIAAVVVLYDPDATVLSNVDSFLKQVDIAIAVDNSDTLNEAIRSRLIDRGVVCISMDGNKGIASALNAGCRRASELGYPWAFTMDQDSTATPGLVAALSEPLSGEGSEDIAIVAPAWEQVGGAPVERHSDALELDYAMTSGNLLRLSAFDSLKGFRDDLFIDHVDNEFCMRARTAGWRIVQRRDVILLHRQGQMTHVRFPFPFYTLNYGPVRRYYMARNYFEVSREFGAAFPGWLSEEKAHWRKDLLKMTLGERQRLSKWRMLFRGWSDFRARRFGRYEDLHLPRNAPVGAGR